MPIKFFLIDGHSHCYRAYYALPPLTAPDGRPTGAVVGFTNILFKILREQNPDYVAVAFDSREVSFRHNQYAEYKANRKVMPDDLALQIDTIKEIVEACNIPIIAKPGFEADDIIGTLAMQAAQKGIDVYIATNDKDSLQLLDGHVRRFDAATGRVYTSADLMTEKGITPAEVTDVMALSGDTSDNVPGVEGIGEKTALQLIKQWGSLENVLANIDKITGEKRRERLARDAELARLSKTLVTIDMQVPLDTTVEDCKRRPMNTSRLLQLFRELDFKKHAADIAKEVQTAAPAATDGDYHLVNTPELFEAFLAELKQAPEFAFDLESTSVRPLEAEIVGFSFSWKEHQAWYLPIRGLGGSLLPQKETLAALKPILENEKTGKTGQNLKYDGLVLRRAGISLNGIAFDTLLAAYLLDPGRLRNNLAELALDFLGESKTRISELIGKGKKEISMDFVDVGSVCRYACEDADTAWRLTGVLRQKLQELGLFGLLHDVELPQARVLLEMEWHGVKIDVPVLREMSEKIGADLNKLEDEIKQQAGPDFNVASPKQLSKLLFEEFGLTKSKRTTLGYSTSASVLESLSNQHDLPALVLKYRQLSKLKSTYIDALPKMVNKRTTKVHTSFNQTVTSTGRLSSSAPNLQNIPIRTELGRSIRRAFVPSNPGWQMLTADYSQVELRMLADLSEDPTLMAAFWEDKDIHAFVASQIYGVDLPAVTPDMRRKAKAVNFGIVYGLTPFGLSKGIGISVDEARQFIDAYFRRYSRVKEYIDSVIAEARQRGFVVTKLNRRRNIPTINSTNDQERKFAERIAINTVIQGSAADLIKVAMNNIYSRLTAEGHAAKILLQIHDELVFEVPNAEMLFARTLIEHEMANAMKLRVPIKVNIEVGPNWLEAK